MRVVLDTNSLLASIAKKSKYRPIFDGILRGKFTVLISNEILSEYTEIIETGGTKSHFSNMIIC